MTDTASRFSTHASDFASFLDGADGGWDAPTPCEGWTVRDVVSHLIESERDFLAQHDIDLPPAPDLSDPAAAWRSHATVVTDALATDGVSEREFEGYFGPTTIGATMADFYGWDVRIHGSDVARATGQEWTVDEATADELLADVETWGDALYAEGICAPAVPVGPDASPTDRVLATLGRDPAWRPPN